MALGSVLVMVTLPTIEWGDPTSPRTALLIHGINGYGAGWWRLADALAADGWHVTAVDLRGHGSAPRADSYRVTDYVSDLPGHDWDVVVGHSLGGAISVAAAARPGFARALVLLDPVLSIPDADHAAVHAEQVAELSASMTDLEAERPLWHPLDIQHKFDASQLASPAMVDGTFTQNRPWDLLDRASTINVDTLILGADPAVYTFFPPEQADAVVTANPRVTYRAVPGAGHSPHRDRFDDTVRMMRDWLTSAGEPRP